MKIMSKKERYNKELVIAPMLPLAAVIWIRKHYVPYSKEFGIGALAKKFNRSYDVISDVVHNRGGYSV